MTTVEHAPGTPTEPPEEPARPPIAAAALSVILPAGNRVTTIEATLQGWLVYLDSLQRDYELILVDDGSTDGTAAAAQAVAAQQPKLRVLQHPERRGFGACLRTGLTAASHPLLAYASCEPQYPPAELAKLLARIDLVDLASGCRSALPVPTPLRVTGFLWRWLVRSLFGIPQSPLEGWLGGKSQAYQKLIRAAFGVRIRDLDSPFKLFRRSIFDRIPLQADGEFVHAEILAKANFLGCLMDEPNVAIAASWEPDPQRWQECRRIFQHPDFGPAILEKQSNSETRN